MNIKDYAKNPYSFTNILVDAKTYSSKLDNRLLIPFIHFQHIGFFNKDGEVVVEPRFDRVLDDIRSEKDVVRVGIYCTYGYNRASGTPSTYMRAKWGLLNSKGETLIEPEMREIRVSDDKRLLTIQNWTSRWGVITVDGEEVVPFGSYGWMDAFDHGLCRVKRQTEDGRNFWGIIDSDGKIVLPLDFTAVYGFSGKNRASTTIETIDEHGNKRIGTFDLLSRTYKI